MVVGDVGLDLKGRVARECSTGLENVRTGSHWATKEEYFSPCHATASPSASRQTSCPYCLLFGSRSRSSITSFSVTTVIWVMREKEEAYCALLAEDSLIAKISP